VNPTLRDAGGDARSDAHFGGIDRHTRRQATTCAGGAVQFRAAPQSAWARGEMAGRRQRRSGERDAAFGAAGRVFKYFNVLSAKYAKGREKKPALVFFANLRVLHECD
jgi:hypothetical protein